MGFTNSEQCRLCVKRSRNNDMTCLELSIVIAVLFMAGLSVHFDIIASKNFQK